LAEPGKFKISDVLYGLVIPILVAILIIIFPAVLRPALDGWFPPPNMETGDPGSSYAFVTVIFTHGFALMVCFAIPLILGLVWNKWAGGAAGFIMGTLYYVAYAGYYTMYNIQNFLPYVLADTTQLKTWLPNLFADPSFIGGYIVGGILIGYIAGALSNKSFTFKRMLGAGLTASITVGILQFILNYTVAFGAWMTQSDPGFALFTALLPMIILGVIGPIVAKVLTWYGLLPGGHS